MFDRTVLPEFQPSAATRSEIALNALVDRLESRWLDDEAFGKRKRAMFISWCAQQADVCLGGLETCPSAFFDSLAAYRRRCVRTHDFLDFVRRTADRIAAGAGTSHRLGEIVEAQARSLMREMDGSPSSARYLICAAVAHAFGVVAPMRDVVCLFVEGMVAAGHPGWEDPNYYEIEQYRVRGMMTEALVKIDAMPEFAAPATPALDAPA